ncbi:hypothetical protein B0H15DRAFT_136692 [Mycena belliarum]|uniref:Uncharacterized protein n=1 Tax=Mycena belliarum TaxID=1033014 RepID=A0AAD6U8A8_9AGAR|nr:hypothetical protein B0H15DRAFT_136692 [Mycena belliae]
MFALRFTSLFFLASTAFVAASPVLEERQSTADIQTVLATLQSATGAILPQIDALVSGGNATDDTVTPLVTSLTGALDIATAALAVLPAPTGAAKRQSNDEIAKVVAGLITEITKTLDGLLGSAATIPGLGNLLGGLDASLNQVLKGLERLLAGVLNLVAQLLVDVAKLLRALAFGLTLASLGL